MFFILWSNWSDLPIYKIYNIKQFRTDQLKLTKKSGQSGRLKKSEHAQCYRLKIQNRRQDRFSIFKKYYTGTTPIPNKNNLPYVSTAFDFSHLANIQFRLQVLFGIYLCLLLEILLRLLSNFFRFDKKNLGLKPMNINIFQ